MNKARLFAPAAALVAFLLPLAALADEAPASVSRDLSRYKETSVSGELLLVAAYAVLWLLVAAYAFRLAGKQARLEQQLEALDRQLDAQLDLSQSASEQAP